MTLFKDIKWGVLDDVRPDENAPVYSSAGTSPDQAIKISTEAGYTPDITKSLEKLNGWVLGSLRPPFHKRMMTKALKDGAQAEWVYYVYIPEIEPRGRPQNPEDPKIFDYLEVYAAANVVAPGSDSKSPKRIPNDTEVGVEFKDLESLTDPVIVEIIGESPFEGAARSAGPGGAGGGSSRNAYNGSDCTQPAGGSVPVPPADAPTITEGSPDAREKKKKAEGFAGGKLYNDPAGYCTVGMGHLVDGLRSCSEAHARGKIPEKWLKGGLPPDGKNTRAASPTITRAEAEEQFIKDWRSKERSVNYFLKKAGKPKLSQDQYDAVLSVAFNAGEGSANRYIIKPHLAKTPVDYDGAAGAFTVPGRMKYWHPDHPVHNKGMPGIKRLREKERALFSGSPAPSSGTPSSCVAQSSGPSAPTAREGSAPRVSGGSRILLIGDSQMAGTSLSQEIKRDLEKQGAQEVKILAKPTRGLFVKAGFWSIEDSGGLVQTTLKNFKPNLVIVGLGGNDSYTMWHDNKREIYEARVRKWVNVIQGASSQVIWLGPSHSSKIEPSGTPYDRLRQKIREHQQGVLGSLSVPWYNMKNLTEDLEKSDGTHFTSTSYRQWAQRLLDGPLSGVRSSLSA